MTLLERLATALGFLVVCGGLCCFVYGVVVAVLGWVAPHLPRRRGIAPQCCNRAEAEDVTFTPLAQGFTPRAQRRDYVDAATGPEGLGVAAPAPDIPPFARTHRPSAVTTWFALWPEEKALWLEAMTAARRPR